VGEDEEFEGITVTVSEGSKVRVSEGSSVTVSEGSSVTVSEGISVTVSEGVPLVGPNDTLIDGLFDKMLPPLLGDPVTGTDDGALKTGEEEGGGVDGTITGVLLGAIVTVVGSLDGSNEFNEVDTVDGAPVKVTDGVTDGAMDRVSQDGSDDAILVAVGAWLTEEGE
jgi:hypothetical protein